MSTRPTKVVTTLVTILLLTLALTQNVFAYEGGTKYVATLTRSQEGGEVQVGPLLLTPGRELTASKPVVEFFHRRPEPTLSMTRIRQERPGPSTGTKLVAQLRQRG